MKQHLSTILKGIWIGGTLTVPGVSGGSMAMILGIYERLIVSVNSLMKRTEERKKSAKFLLIFTLSALLGIFALSGVVIWALERFPTPILFLFAGIVAGGLPLILGEVKRSRFRWYHILLLIFGIMLVIVLSALPKGALELGYGRGLSGIFSQFFCGIAAAFALVLPGISVSHMLYVLGVYEGIMRAVSSADFIALLPFALGTFFGIALSAKAVSKLISRFRCGVYMLIFGFVLGSVFELLNDVDVRTVSFLCLMLFFTGFFGMFFLFNKKKADA
jgi:putative membrane protein